MDDVAKTKSLIRARMLKLRSEMNSEEKLVLEAIVCEQLIKLITENHVQTLHTYLPMGLELNHVPVIDYCLQAGIRMITPKTLNKPRLKHLELKSLDELEDGIFGTKHPTGDQEWNSTYDMIIVPGLAFDQLGNRLGYGGGYYDAFLINHPASLKVAVCFPFQYIDQVPHSEFDQRVDLVIH